MLYAAQAASDSGGAAMERGLAMVSSNWRVPVPSVGVACWLFSTVIEKGVLMSGRVLAAIGSATRDEAWADELCDAFAAAPPPLTA